MSKPRTCHICGTITSCYCPVCTAAFENRRPADEMTGDERAAELELLYGPLEIKFTLLHRRIEELVGRSVFAHELVMREALIEEARTRDHSQAAETFTAALRSISKGE